MIRCWRSKALGGVALRQVSYHSGVEVDDDGLLGWRWNERLFNRRHIDDHRRR